MTNPSAVPPSDCRSMAEVRAGVDAIDAALVTLLAERQRYMAAAARIKPSRDQVHDRARIEEVVARVIALGSREGLCPPSPRRSGAR